jgi:drug/metabolite transporter (DMT)-like permease
MLRRFLLLLFGVMVCSTAVIMMNASHTHPIVLAAMRLLLASIVMAPIAWREYRRHEAVFTREHLRRTLLPSVIFALHMITWAYGARMTIVAQASLLVNFAPAAIPFFLHWLVGERINRWEIIGTGIALTGVLTLGIRDALAGGGSVWGNIVCFVSMLLFACYLALDRRNRDFPSIWLYMVPVYLKAGLICAVVALPWWHTYAVHDRHEWLMMIGLALLPTIIGHTVLNASMRHLRGQIVSLCNVGQFIFAGIMAWLLFHQLPPGSFYLASALVVIGVSIVVFKAPTAPPRMR